MSSALSTCLLLHVAWDQVAQMLTAIVAAAALFIAPRLSFNASRRLVVAQSRQAWLDAIRADVAAIISLHQKIVVSRTKAKVHRQPEPPSDEDMTRISALSAQVRMRLNVTEPEQENLMIAINKFVCNYDQENPEYSSSGIMDAIDPIVRRVWKEIKDGRV